MQNYRNQRGASYGRVVTFKEKTHLEDLGIDANIVLKWIIKKYDRRAYSGFIWLGIGASGGFF